MDHSLTSSLAHVMCVCSLGAVGAVAEFASSVVCGSLDHWFTGWEGEGGRLS
ncbi:hypothetical protein M758_1G070100 [Ceratodon purpureus]|uniref:Uncharacterized protein n=1 Tax=Ceratodon purpureus TaxID=3225 RepID=A0A8T0J4N5_CERPU|nr:hypothetical protein KC19_1G071500 [Ceratodon purpureus]KAG0629010.1 hypothetical protein M758_1G070100 [Ceratodon purpureus]